MSAGRRLLAVALAAVLVLGACSDAHTDEEKEWADTGIDPDATFVVAPPRLARLARELVATYNLTQESAGPFLFAVAEDDEAVERIDEVDGPALWIGPASVVADLDPDTQAALGEDPLAAVGEANATLTPPTFAQIAGLADATTGLCDDEQPCGASTEELFAALDIEPDPTEYGPPADLVEAAAEEDLDLVLVPRSYGVAGFPKVANHPLPRGSDGADPQVVSAYGGGEAGPAFIEWLERGIGLLAPRIEVLSGIRQPTAP